MSQPIRFQTTVELWHDHKDERWRATVRTQEYRQGRHYGGALFNDLVSRRNAQQKGFLRRVRAVAKKQQAIALT